MPLSQVAGQTTSTALSETVVIPAPKRCGKGLNSFEAEYSSSDDEGALVLEAIALSLPAPPVPEGLLARKGKQISFKLNI